MRSPWCELANLYCSAKFGWNWCSSYGCYAACSRRLEIHCVKTWRHQQNRKYITYHNAVRRGPRPRPQATCTKNTAKGGRVVSEICTRTDRQTDILITIVRTPSRGEVTSAETKVYTVIVDKGDCDDNDNDDRQYGVKGSKVMEIDAYDDVRDSVTIYYSQKKQRRLD